MVNAESIDVAPPPDADLIPTDVQKYLLPAERLVATVRRHPAVLLSPSTWAVGGLLVAFVLTATLLRSQSVLIWIVWGLWGIIMLRLVWEAWNWAVDYFVITDKRILLTSGVFTRSVAMMPLSKVTDMSFRRSFSGRMLGYGDFVVESAGQDQALRTIDHIPYPEDLYQKICDEIFFDKKVAKPPACALDRLKPGGSVVITRRGGSGDEHADIFEDPSDTSSFDQDDFPYLDSRRGWLIEPDEPVDNETDQSED